MKRIANQTQVFIVACTFWLVGAVMVSAQPSTLPALKPNAPDYSHANQALPDGVISWDALSKTEEVMDGEGFARFTFDFTNVTTGNVIVLNVHPSCGCTTAELPPVPWTIPAGAKGQIKARVNLAGKSGTLFKTLSVTTDKGMKTLMLRIEIKPKPVLTMTGDQRAAGVAAAKLDREAVFKGDCATCHSSGLENKYGQQLFATACGICHEAKERASMVPDLHHLTDATGKPIPTDEEFWRSWITAGKEGTLMPAFAKSQGGPLTDLQIASLAAYLNVINPPHLTQASAK